MLWSGGRNEPVPLSQPGFSGLQGAEIYRCADRSPVRAGRCPTERATSCPEISRKRRESWRCGGEERAHLHVMRDVHTSVMHLDIETVRAVSSSRPMLECGKTNIVVHGICRLEVRFRPVHFDVLALPMTFPDCRIERVRRFRRGLHTARVKNVVAHVEVNH